MRDALPHEDPVVVEIHRRLRDLTETRDDPAAAVLERIGRLTPQRLAARAQASLYRRLSAGAAVMLLALAGLSFWLSRGAEGDEEEAARLSGLPGPSPVPAILMLDEEDFGTMSSSAAILADLWVGDLQR